MKNKKLFILIILLVNAGLLFAQKKPNIVIFISDDQSQVDMGAYGNKDVHTPNMDRLAAEGMKFNKAYAATSMCTPSRCNMFTGLYPYRNGSQFNHFAVKPGTKSLPHYLKALGYRVVLAGKTHITPRASFPFEYISEEMGRYKPIAERSDPKGETVQFIKEYFSNENEEKQPLCLVVATLWPHVPWLPNRDFDPAALHVPEFLLDTKETRAALAAYYQSISEADKLLGEVMEAVEETAEQDNTAFMFFSDQGAQLPAAKWTAYDQGLRIPFIVRWPGKIKAGSTSDALISLTDLTPTLVELAGGDPVEGLDGKSFANVFLGKKTGHHDYIFAETSVEPHYWYNYTPSRSIITKEGLHYIRNYYPGVRFITHIDVVEQNMYYFDTWVEAAEENEKAQFLLNRYSYRQPEELFNLQKDRWEFNNLVNVVAHKQALAELRELLNRELTEMGETEEMILQGQLPDFQARSYEVGQGISAHQMSFNKQQWNPDTLFVTGYIEGMEQNGILLKYFNQFKVMAENNRLALLFDDGKAFYSEPLKDDKGHLLMRLSSQGDFELKLNGEELLQGQVSGDPTKIRGGYVSVGFARDEAPPLAMPAYFPGKIHNMRFTMNKLNGEK